VLTFCGRSDVQKQPELQTANCSRMQIIWQFIQIIDILELVYYIWKSMYKDLSLFEVGVTWRWHQMNVTCVYVTKRDSR
jgi:hypothetical protein